MFAISDDSTSQQSAGEALASAAPHGEVRDAVLGVSQVLVDVLGVVTAVGPMRSIKRKQDGSEFVCRDVTIADAGCVPLSPLLADPSEACSSVLLLLRLEMPPTVFMLGEARSY